MPSFVGRFMILAGAILIVMGIVILSKGRVPFLGRLPGDIRIEREGFRFYFPIVTCIIISIVLSLIMILLTRKS